MIVRGIEKKKWVIRTSKHIWLATCQYGVCGIEGRLGVSVWAVDIDTIVGGEFRSIALLMAADF